MENNSNNNNSGHQNEKKSFLFKLSTLLASLFSALLWISLLSVLILRVAVFQQVNVVGVSMQPNYYQDEQLFVNQVDRDIKRGHVVAVYEDINIAKDANYFTRFDGKTIFYLKRVIGLPGEEIEILNGKVVIYNQQYPQGKILVEDYLSKTPSEVHFDKIKIPEGYYFLMGDNRDNSYDSREVGPFPEYAILGVEFVRFWPLRKLEVFSLPDYDYRDLTKEEENKLVLYNQTQG
jgi:signal peptidase I